jgi:membrane associated rhomboid family serine protease
MNDQTDDDAPAPPDLPCVRYIVNGDQIPSLSPADLNLPLEICDGFWSLNTHNQRLSTPSDTLLMSYCPQLIGPCCTPVRCRDYLRLLKSFTVWLMAAQITVFGIALSKSRCPLPSLEIDRPVLLQLGALSLHHLKDRREYWRLFTGIFLHGNIAHLFVNVAIELIFVLSREASWNTLRLIVVFFGSEISGNFLTFCLDPEMTAVGSGNGIFGVYGGFIALYGILFEGLQWKHRIAVLFMLFLNGILLIFTTNDKHNNNWGHASGMACGFCVGLALFAHRAEGRKRKSCAYIFGGVLSLVLLLGPILYFLLILEVDEHSNTSKQEAVVLKN